MKSRRMEWTKDAIHMGNWRIACNISVKEIEEINHPKGLDTNNDTLRA
jgi:hypothetical protein